MLPEHGWQRLRPTLLPCGARVSKILNVVIVLILAKENNNNNRSLQNAPFIHLPHFKVSGARDGVIVGVIVERNFGNSYPDYKT